MIEKKQILVRSYKNGTFGETKDIDKLLKEGYVVKHITPFPTEDYLEYILEKDFSINNKFKSAWVELIDEFFKKDDKFCVADRTRWKIQELTQKYNLDEE